MPQRSEAPDAERHQHRSKSCTQAEQCDLQHSVAAVPASASVKRLVSEHLLLALPAKGHTADGTCTAQAIEAVPQLC